MKFIILITIFTAKMCLQAKAQTLPAINLNEQTINNFTAINNNKNVLLPPVDTSFLSSHLICQPGGCTLLLLQLLEFDGKTTGTINHLYWKTENEINTSHFEIQRSPDAVIFKPIGNINAINTSGTDRYFFDDNSPMPGKNYYRLRMVDIDKKFTYSRTILLERNGSGKISLYPNPASHIIKIEIQSLAAGNYEFTITDMAGRKILVEKRTAINGLNNWELNINHIMSGFYILAIRNKKEEVITNIPLEIIH